MVFLDASASPEHSPPALAAVSAQTLALRLLGGFDVQINGQGVTGFTYNKMRALLAYLALEPVREHQRDVLADLLWQNCKRATARGNLRRTLAHLRRVLEAVDATPRFVATKNTLRLLPGVWVDAAEFLQLASSPPSVVGPQAERLLALYRGEFLAGLSVADSSPFEEWLQNQRENLHRHALGLLERLARDCEQQGEHGKALRFALRRTELEPGNEDAQAQVMRLYALSGRKSAAIIKYEGYCRLLREGPGTLPQAGTRQAAERIWRSEPLQDGGIPAATIIERRQATVLYCDLNPRDSDDPDEAMSLLHGCQTRCISILEGFAGHLVQIYGGGLLAYFGYPCEHVNAALNAVQAALAISREAGNGMDVLVGVHSGLIIANSALSIPDIFGQTSRLATHLCHYAGRGEVAVSRETRDQVADSFTFTRYGRQSLPGLAQPLEIFKVSA